jgi:hypothetical protein
VVGFAAETRRLAPPTAGLVRRLASERGLVVIHGHPQSTRLAPHLSASSGYTLTGQSSGQKVTGLAHYFLLTPLLRGETVLVLDAANSFNPHRLASLARRTGRNLTPMGSKDRQECLSYQEAVGHEALPYPGKENAGGGKPRPYPNGEQADDEGNGGLRRRYPNWHSGGGAMAWLERVRLSRAFTCFQLAELIERTPAAARRTGARRVVLTGVPDIFDDEELSDAEARAVFRRALARLRGWKPPVLTTLVFSDQAAQRRGLRAQLERELFRQADGVYRLEESAAGLWLREEKGRLLVGTASGRPSTTLGVNSSPLLGVAKSRGPQGLKPKTCQPIDVRAKALTRHWAEQQDAGGAWPRAWPRSYTNKAKLHRCDPTKAANASEARPRVSTAAGSISAAPAPIARQKLPEGTGCHQHPVASFDCAQDKGATGLNKQGKAGK